ncbi:MAG: hypothetical protein IT306_12275 [Chloroflexi bacterium]|nr:hypothetical protein [Chloroflexota bacterium]
MFNWYTAPTFATSLLFCLLAAYVVTRSRRDAATVAAVVALISTAAYLLGEAMEMNAPSRDLWLIWGRSLRWGAPVAPAGWFWLTALFLREQDSPTIRQFLRRIGYPLGGILAVGCFGFTVTTYLGDALWNWSAATFEDVDGHGVPRWIAPVGWIYPLFTAYLVLAAGGVAANLLLAWRASRRERGHGRFSLLLLSLALFMPEFGSLVAYHWLGRALPTWLNHLSLAVAMGLMATSVAAYHHLRHGQTIRADLAYFVATWTVLGVGFVPIFLMVSGGYSFQTLGLLVVTTLLILIGHTVSEPVRRELDRLFFGSEVQRLRSSLSLVVQDAALAQDETFGDLLTQARTELDEVSAEHMARLTQEALRRLNAPASLADSALAERLPATVASVLQAAGPTDGAPLAAGAAADAPTALERAQALRTALSQAIDRLKPPDAEHDPGAPAALQFHILHEAYVLGRPNRQIMTRRGISESTFHRNRREAVAVLARELHEQEGRLQAQVQDGLKR